MSDPGITCSNCGAIIAPGSRFCERCGTPFAQTMPAPLGSYAASMTPAGHLRPSDMRIYAGSDPLLSFDIDYPEWLSRWKIFVKWLIAIPHLVILYFLGIAVSVVWIIAWIAILITGRFPRGMWDFMLTYMRWSANVCAYAFSLQRDEYPPFGDEPYPVHLDLEYPDRLSRWKIFLKWLLIFPHLFVLAFLGLAAAVAIVIAWFAILITGRFPRGLFEFVTGYFRWTYRVTAYYYLMTDKYPPFSLE